MAAGLLPDIKVILAIAFVALLLLQHRFHIRKFMNSLTKQPRASAPENVSGEYPTHEAEFIKPLTRKLWNIWEPNGHPSWELELVAKSM